MASDLTTLALLNAYLGASASTYSNEQKNAAVAAANNAIEEYCDRTFAATDYAEWMNGPGSVFLSLDQLPLIRLNRAAVSGQNGISITNSSSDMVQAVVSVTEGELNLVIVGGTNDGSDQLTLASYTTLALLDTAITALGKGWAASVQTEEQPKAIRPTSESLGTSSDTVYLQVPDDSTSAIIRDKDEGLIYVPTGWGCGQMSVYVDYRAGYAAADMPGAITDIANSVASDLLRRAQRDPGLKSEKLGEYSWTAKDSVSSVVASYEAGLAPFRRHSLA